MQRRSLAHGDARFVLVSRPAHIKVLARRFKHLRILKEIGRGERQRFGRDHHAFAPMLEPAHAADCQLWPGVPGTKVAVPICAVGTFQLTSATSVDPPTADDCSSAPTVAAFSSGAASGLRNVLRSVPANAVSSGV